MKVRLVYLEQGMQIAQIIKNVHEIHYNFDFDRGLSFHHTAFEYTSDEGYATGWNVRTDHIIEMEVKE